MNPEASYFHKALKSSNLDVGTMMSPLKDPLRIENVENIEEDNYDETIKVEDVVQTKVKPKSKNCPSCGKYFEKDLSRHIGRVHGEKKWSCEQCDAKFIVKSNLVRHVKAVHIGELVQCDMCPHKARDKRNVDVFSDFMLLFVSKLCVR